MSAATRRGSKPVHGVLVVDKPRGPTSHDVVGVMRRTFGTRRVGHAGTLDPMATGVLVLLFGEATKLSAVLTRDTKEYEAVVEFGKATDTLDAEGRPTRSKMLEPGWLEHARLGRALERELYREWQIPPVVSAIRVGGERAHALTRQGMPPELPPREVRVHGLELLDWSQERARLRLVVSKGYYVRALARDLGESLDVPAHLSSLRRTASGAFRITEAGPYPPDADTPLTSVADAVRRSLPVLELNAEGARRFRLGQLIRPEDRADASSTPRASRPPLDEPEVAPETDTTWGAFAAGHFLGLLEPTEIPNHFRVKRGFVETGTAEPDD